MARVRPWEEAHSWATVWRSSTVTSAPRAASAQPAARPITPPPTTSVRGCGMRSILLALPDRGQHLAQDLGETCALRWRAHRHPHATIQWRGAGHTDKDVALG